MNASLAVLNALCKVLDATEKLGVMTKNRSAIRKHILDCIDLIKETL